MPPIVKRKHNLFGYRCAFTECDFSERTIDLVKEHVNKVHLNVKPISCSICGLSFFGNPSLVHHSKSHAKREFKCTFDVNCNYETHDKSKLEVHLRRHQNLKPHKCLWPGCDSSFITLKELERFLFLQSFRQFIFQTKVHSFNILTHNYSHEMYRHSDEKPIVCEWPDCGARSQTL